MDLSGVGLRRRRELAEAFGDRLGIIRMTSWSPVCAGGLGGKRSVIILALREVTDESSRGPSLPPGSRDVSPDQVCT